MKKIQVTAEELQAGIQFEVVAPEPKAELVSSTPYVDWGKLPQGTPVIGWDDAPTEKHKDRFEGLDKGAAYPFGFSDGNCYKNAEIDYTAKNAWIPWWPTNGWEGLPPGLDENTEIVLVVDGDMNLVYAVDVLWGTDDEVEVETPFIYMIPAAPEVE